MIITIHKLQSKHLSKTVSHIIQNTSAFAPYLILNKKHQSKDERVKMCGTRKTQIS